MGLERFRPMLWWCNLTGLLPFRMEVEGSKFKKFSFSYRHPVTWWCFIISLLLMINLVVFSLVIICIKDVSNRSFATGHFAVAVARFHYISNAALAFVSSWLLFKFKQLKEVVQELHFVDVNIDARIARVTCSTIPRTVIAFLVTCALLIAEAVMIFTPLNSSTDLVMSYNLIIAFYVCDILMLFRIITFFVTFYLCYYAIANRISLLVRILQENKKCLNGNALQVVRCLFNRLCRAGTKLNECFALPVAVAVIFKIISCTLTLFLYIHATTNVEKPDSTKELWLCQFLVDSGFLLCVFIAADLPAEEVGPLREQLIDFTTQKLSDNEIYESECFLKQAKENRVRLSVYGTFNVGKSLLPSLVGIVLTYLIVLLQTTASSQL